MAYSLEFLTLKEANAQKRKLLSLGERGVVVRKQYNGRYYVIVPHGSPFGENFGLGRL